MRIWLVRHGEAAWQPGLALGWSDPPLSPLGRRQARELGRLLATAPLEAVFASDLLRARSTAEALAAPHRLTVTVSPALRELDFGPWDGRRLSELWIEHPDQARAWEEDVTDSPAAFSESVADLEARVQRFAAGLTDSGGREIAVVAHLGSLAALRAFLLGGDFASSIKLGFELGRAFQLEI